MCRNFPSYESGTFILYHLPPLLPFQLNPSPILPLGTLPHDFKDLKFDGEYKGKLGSSGYGGVLRDHHRSIIFIFSNPLGHTSNNYVELKVTNNACRWLTPWDFLR